MSIRQQQLLAITLLFFSNAVLAEEDSGYLAVTNAGYVDVTVTVEARSPADSEQSDIYLDQLIIDDADVMTDESGVYFSAADDE